jgi:hypothetical protein
LQLGGGPKELYYYPKDTMEVINVGPDVNRSKSQDTYVFSSGQLIARYWIIHWPLLGNAWTYLHGQEEKEHSQEK